MKRRERRARRARARAGAQTRARLLRATCVVQSCAGRVSDCVCVCEREEAKGAHSCTILLSVAREGFFVPDDDAAAAADGPAVEGPAVDEGSGLVCVGARRGQLLHSFTGGKSRSRRAPRATARKSRAGNATHRLAPERLQRARDAEPASTCRPTSPLLLLLLPARLGRPTSCRIRSRSRPARARSRGQLARARELDRTCCCC